MQPYKIYIYIYNIMNVRDFVILYMYTLILIPFIISLYIYIISALLQEAWRGNSHQSLKEAYCAPHQHLGQEDPALDLS